MRDEEEKEGGKNRDGLEGKEAYAGLVGWRLFSAVLQEASRCRVKLLEANVVEKVVDREGKGKTINR